MPKIENPCDDVCGRIVGGDYGLAFITYEGRKQGSTVYPKNEAEARDKCMDILQEIKHECGDSFSEIYPKSSWKFYFYGV